MTDELFDVDAARLQRQGLARPVCCDPTDPPTAAAYKRHLRTQTVPCQQSLNDSNAYRRARKDVARSSTRDEDSA